MTLKNTAARGPPLQLDRGYVPLTSRSQFRGRAAACDIAKDMPK